MIDRTCMEKYNFVDFGSGGGDFMDIARGFGGTRGLGVENDPIRVRDINKRGKDCVHGDVRHLEWLPEKCVSFVTVNHLLEHMRTLHDARLVVRSAARLARDFVYVGGPNFDKERALATQGLKFYWADWPDSHPLHLTTDQLAWVLMMENLTRFLVWATMPIKSSGHPDVHPLSSPLHCGHYDPEKHPAKPEIKFPLSVHTQFACLCVLREEFDMSKLLAGREGWQIVQRGPLS